MIVKAREASKKLCAILASSSNGSATGTNCRGSNCMQWRWLSSSDPKDPEGYCGLGGPAYSAPAKSVGYVP